VDEAGVDQKAASLTSTEARAALPMNALLAVRMTVTCLFALMGFLGWALTLGQAERQKASSRRTGAIPNGM